MSCSWNSLAKTGAHHCSLSACAYSRSFGRCASRLPTRWFDTCAFWLKKKMVSVHNEKEKWLIPLSGNLYCNTKVKRVCTKVVKRLLFTISTQGQRNECYTNKLQSDANNCKLLKIRSTYLKQKTCTKRAYTGRARTKSCHGSTLKPRCSNKGAGNKYTEDKCELSQYLLGV